MSDETTTPADDEAEKQEPAAGLYVFYDNNREVQIGVSGDYTIAEAIFVLGAAKAKLELLQYHAFKSEQAEQRKPASKILIPH